MFIDPKTVNSIRGVDIVELVSSYIELDREGKTCCPFHTENTPSFSVNKQKKIFKCFGCGEGGGSIDFVMKYLHISFTDACKVIADKFNIYIPNRPPRKPLNVPINTERGVMKSPRKINAPSELWRSKAFKLIEYCHRMIYSEGNEKVIAYLEKRGFSKDEIDKYQIGYHETERYRTGVEWGLSIGIKKLWIPKGIVIPMVDPEKKHVRLRIRRSVLSEKDIKYAVVSGSSQRSLILNAVDSRVIFIFESELDAMAFRSKFNYCTLSFGSSVLIPCKEATSIMDKSIKIVVAYDNDKAGKKGYDLLFDYMKGRKYKYLDRFTYHPTPYHKDFGDALKDNTFDANEWVYKVLPEVVRAYPIKQDYSNQQSLI